MSAAFANSQASTGSLPQKREVVVSARAAYSHSVSDGRRQIWPVCAETKSAYALASCQLTLMTGRVDRPQPRSSGWVRSLRSANASYRLNVISSRLILNEPTHISRGGPSLRKCEPIVAQPLGMLTMSGSGITFLSGLAFAESWSSERGSTNWVG